MHKFDLVQHNQAFQNSQACFTPLSSSIDALKALSQGLCIREELQLV